MRVEFWFDPGCPFCWVTSRWVNQVSPERDLSVTWRSISLLFKNDPPPDSPFYARAAWTRDLLRVVEAARAGGHDGRLGELYSAFGIRIHNRGLHRFDVGEVLDELGLDPALADAADDERWDVPIRDSMDDGLSLTGTDVGTPLIAIPGRNGRVGLFGPVLSELPDARDGLDLWDGFVGVARTSGFHELKRTRTGPPTIPPEEPAPSRSASPTGSVGG